LFLTWGASRVDRVACFIDGGYLLSLVKEQFGSVRVDFQKLSNEMSAGHNLLRVYYYNCPPYQSHQPTQDEIQRKQASDRFHTALQRLPRFEVRLGKLAFKGTDQASGRPIFQQKRVDIMLGVDLVQLAATRQIQRAVLLAGDSDFLPAVQVAKQHGVLVALWHGPTGQHRSVHQELWDECDERVEITQAVVDRIT
ncbi:MAG: NYN domain-containing protein, partial [Candidatus Eremiobacterota bacterium]